jgi:lipopolysaccharide export system permease protein
MFHRYRLLVLTALVLFTVVFTQHLEAQTTRADSAAILLEATRRLELEGESDAARELLDLIVRHFPGSPAAIEAETMLSASQTRETETSGRASLIAFSTLYGAWLGVAVPAAMGANEPEPYGAGLLIGAPLGIMTRKSSWTLGVAIGMFFIYWAFLIAGEELADRLIITPFMAMWLPNLIMGAVGLWISYQAMRERRVLSANWARFRRRKQGSDAANANLSTS